MNRTPPPISAGLHIVSTPIGAARDISLRALDILGAADILAAEDTRTARKLLDLHGVPLSGRRIVAYHDHSGPGARADLVAAAQAGASVAYASEAGTPLVADPGFDLVRSFREADLPVFVAPGASAILAALVLAGLPTDRFAFAGFLPARAAAREAELIALKDLPMTLVLYESPKRVAALLATVADILGRDRPVAVCRELTKRHEEVLRGKAADVAAEVASGPTRGEYVVVIGAATADGAAADAIDEALRDALRTMRIKDAATAVAGALNLNRREVYQRALALKGDD